MVNAHAADAPAAAVAPDTDTPSTRTPLAPTPLPPGLLGEWRWWLPPAILALALALVFKDPFAGDWDALDYTVLALRGEPSSMLFGRMLFIYTNHILFRFAHAAFGLPPESAYLLFKYFVIAQSPLAVVAVWTLARDLARSNPTATVAALLLVLSPFYVIYSGQAMTEIPSILLLAVALTVHLRGLRQRKAWMVLLGALLLGAGVNLREGVALYGLWLVSAPFVCGWRFSARELLLTAGACVVFFIFALGPFAYWYFFDVNGYQSAWWGWVESSRMESALHPVSLANFRILAFWFFVAAPLVVVLPFALYAEWRARGLSPLLVLAVTGLLADLALISHYSTVINGRYLLTGLPALVPLMADFLLRAGRRLARGLARGHTTATDEGNAAGNEARALAFAVLVVVATGLWIGYKSYEAAWGTIQSHGLTREYRGRLEQLPDDAIVMAGGQTVAVSFWRGVGAGNWGWIGTGGGWPGDKLVEVIQNHLKDGRRVFLDTDPQVWSARGWQLEETRAVATLGSQFGFRRVSGTIYEIRPPGDPSARDTPDLQKLLPENR